MMSDGGSCVAWGVVSGALGPAGSSWSRGGEPCSVSVWPAGRAVLQKKGVVVADVQIKCIKPAGCAEP